MLSVYTHLRKSNEMQRLIWKICNESSSKKSSKMVDQIAWLDDMHET